MKLTKNKLFSSIFLFGLTTIILVLFNIQLFYLRAIFSFIFLTTIPGLLIMLMLKIRKIEFWEYFIYTIGLSIAFLMFAGLAINLALPWLHITDKPLSLSPLLTSFYIILSIFGFIGYKKNKKILLKIKLPKWNWKNNAFFAIPIILPVLSTLGSTTLNNYGSNFLIMILLGGIASYVFLIILFKNKLNENIYPWSIFLIAISLLLMSSLRSWHIFGSDINEEFRVFQLTEMHYLWDMSNSFKNVYNACLSITILPTIFYSFLKINNEYILKLIFQIIFAFTPIGIFLLSKKYTNVTLSFIASIFFMSFPSFFFVMPMHLREEISLFFFVLTLLAIFSRNISKLLKYILFLIFSYSMVVSHYTTTYIAIALFTFTYLFSFVFKITENNTFFSHLYKKINLKEKRKSVDRKYYFNGGLIILLIIFTFFWFFKFTNTSSNIVNFTNDSMSSVEKFYKELKQSGTILEQFNISINTKDPTILLNNYIKEVVQPKYKNKTYINFYSPNTYKNYFPKIEYTQILPLNISTNIANDINFFLEAIKKIIKIFIIFGVIYLLFIQFKKKKIDIEYIIFTLVGLTLLVLVTMLPSTNSDYDITRVYQQILVALSLPALFGGIIILRLIKKESIKITFLSLIFIIYFLLYSGFIQQIIGGSYVAPQLNNFGMEYDRFYTFSSEVKSAQWSSTNFKTLDTLIYTDSNGKNILNAFGNNSDFTFADFPIVLPSILDKNAYVYLTVSNKVKKIGFLQIEATPIGYNFPIEFLNDNKNLIYNNGGSEIFK